METDSQSNASSMWNDCFVPYYEALKEYESKMMVMSSSQLQWCKDFCSQHQYQAWRLRIVILPILIIALVFDVNTWMVRTSFHDDHSPSTGTLRTSMPSSSSYSRKNSPIIDIMSIGSLLKQSYQSAQHSTFANNTSSEGRWSKSKTEATVKIRQYYRITEMNDTDTACYTSLSSNQVNDIIQFCQDPNSASKNMDHDNFRGLFHPEKRTGTICAQKRVIDGLYKVLQQYAKQTRPQEHMIPDYLFIIEDDTYINLDLLIPDLQTHFPPTVPYAITGSRCTVPSGPSIQSSNDQISTATTKSTNTLTYPQIGYGIVLTKASIQRLLQPIRHSNADTNTNSGQFSKLVQHQLLQNHMGEMNYHTNGMSIIELMYAFSSQNLYSNIDRWKKNRRYRRTKKDLYTKNANTGYCLTSDTALAYFLHYYLITVPDDQLQALSSLSLDTDELEKFDTMRRQTDTFVQFHATNDTTTSSSNLCSDQQHHHERNDRTCTVYDRICHKVQPEQMESLHNQYYHTALIKS